MRFDGAAQLIGVSPVVTDLRQEIDRVARTDAKVLITGESGTGKEVVARQVYALSNRAVLALRSPVAFMNRYNSSLPQKVLK